MTIRANWILAGGALFALAACDGALMSRGAVSPALLDVIGDNALAATAENLCEGKTYDKEAATESYATVFTALEVNGTSRDDIERMFDTVRSDRTAIAQKVIAFRTKHEVGPDDTEAFCAGIDAEIEANTRIGQLVSAG